MASKYRQQKPYPYHGEDPQAPRGGASAIPVNSNTGSTANNSEQSSSVHREASGNSAMNRDYPGNIDAIGSEWTNYPNQPPPPPYHDILEPRSLASGVDPAEAVHLTAPAGYEYMGAPLQPPSYDEAILSEPRQENQMRFPTITDDDVRDALLRYIDHDACCWGRAAAVEMSINDIQTNSAFHYTLETFAESRTTSWVFEPYFGQEIESVDGHTPPAPWDINVQPTDTFKDGRTFLEVPHTAAVKNCNKCRGSGRTTCVTCRGVTLQPCTFCSGSGHTSKYEASGGVVSGSCICGSCAGTGRRSCLPCSGVGTQPCKICKAKGRLKVYVKLTIRWKVHKDDHVVDGTSVIPNDLIRHVQGDTSFQEEKQRVSPIVSFPDINVNNASRQLVEKHRTSFPMEKILKQRHKIRIVPITTVQSHWSREDFNYYVIGFEKQIYAPEYPLRNCGMCAIL